MANVAVVVLDTVRKDTFDEFFDWLPGKRFDNAYSTSHWTVPAHASLFTGKYGSEVGVLAKNRTLDCKDPVIAERLSDAGYQTRAWTANPNVSQTGNWDRGFDEMAGPYALKRGRDDLLDWDSVLAEIDAGKWETHLRSATRCITGDCATIPSLIDGAKIKLYGDGYAVPDDGASTVRDWVQSTNFGTEEFLFVNLMEAHIPYDPPAGFGVDESVSVGVADTFGGVEDKEQIEDAYRESVRYLSEVYEEIFEGLNESFDYVITLSDHGELLGEYGLWNHVLSLHPELVQVPLVISGKDIEDGTCETTVSILDVHETILSLTEVTPEEDLRGVDLTNETLSAERHFLTEYHGLMSMAAERMRKGGASDSTVSEYETSLSGLVADNYYGYETVDGFREIGTTDIQNPKEHLDSLMEEIVKQDIESESISKATEQRLKDLGYV